jgi:hypothetical protein
VEEIVVNRCGEHCAPIIAALYHMLRLFGEDVTRKTSHDALPVL